MHRGRTAALVASAAALTACGSVVTRPQGAAVSQTPAPSASAAATGAPAATSSPTAAVPATPLLIVMQQTVVEAVDAAGVVHWSFKPATVVGGDQVFADVAGSHLLLAGPGKVAVVDRSGTVVGTGGFAATGAPTLHGDPTGTRWAWSSFDEPPPSSGAYTGAVWVAGLGEAPHRVESWGGNGTSVEVLQWSDRGIVTAVVPQGCGPYLQEQSSAILDPATGRSTPLLGNDRHVTDVHAGLVASVHQSTAYVSGAATFSVTRPAAEGIVAEARISPDGGHVFASLVAADGCGAPPQVRTALGTVATRQWAMLAGEFAVGWYDDGHLVVSDSPYSGGLRIVDLQGRGDAAALTHGDLAGVLR